MSDIVFDPFPGTHPCEKSGCKFDVPYDDEPYCYEHSNDSGSHVRGYSYKAKHTQKEKS